MEHQPHQPHGGEQPDVNTYGTDDPEKQAHIEQARIEAARERKRNRARLERLVELGMQPDDAETFIEFEDFLSQQRKQTREPAATAEPTSTPADPETETAPRYRPRIYVADLASLERGIQHGVWLDAHQDPDNLDADIAAMLDRSSTLPGLSWDTAWAVRATEGFAGLDLYGFTDTTLIATLAKGVADFGAAYAVYVGMVGTSDPDMLGMFEDFYMGSYDSPEAWAEAVGEDLEWNAHLDRVVDPMLRPYVTIDYAAFARDASAHWDVMPGTDGKTHVFMR